MTPRENPVIPASHHNTADAVEMERVSCHNLNDAVRQRFAADYLDRKTQRERSATTVSAGVMGMLSCMCP